jgi:O-antigen/teichoic acid export membrane protein
MMWKLSVWRPSFKFSFFHLRELGSFSRNVSGTMLVTQLTQNTDRVLIGRYLGAAALGPYVLGYNMVLLPLTNMMAPLNTVLYPVFARLRSFPKRLVSAWLRVLRCLVAVALPAMLVLMITAHDAVLVVFGHKWLGAVPVIQILAWVGFLFALQSLNWTVLEALGQAKLMFRFSLLTFIAALISFIVGLRWGVVGVATCFAIASTFTQPLYFYAAMRGITANLKQCITSLSGVVQATIITVISVATVNHLLSATNFSPIVNLIIIYLFALTIYGAACFLRAPSLIQDIVQMIKRRGIPQRSTSKIQDVPESVA